MESTFRSRAPLRLGLAGGGTDLSSYCDIHGGAIVNIAVNRFAHASMKLIDEPFVEIQADDLGIFDRYPLDLLPTDGDLKLHCGVYNHIIQQWREGQPFGAKINTYIDAKPGSGLGASSALTVALVELFRYALDLPLGRYDVAHTAYEIERIDLKLAGGKQDHYAAAFGGANFIEFYANDKVIVNPLNLSDSTQKDIESSIMICYSGRSRASDTVINDQLKNMKSNISNMHQLKLDAFSMKMSLLRGNISQAADILNKSWQAKKSTSKNVSNELIDSLLQTGFDNGAIAGKISGAGGGGYIIFLVKPNDRVRLWSALRAAGGEPDNITISHQGAEAWLSQI